MHDAVQIRMDLGDRLSDHIGKVWEIDGKFYLKRLSDDSCVYVNERGCSLYGKPERPKVCLMMDCRVVAAKHGWKPKAGVIGQRVIDAARRISGH